MLETIPTLEGDAGAVRSVAAGFSAIATALWGQGRSLGQAAERTGIWEGAGALMFRSAGQRLLADVNDAAQSFQAAARALSRYAGTLEEAQQAINRATKAFEREQGNVFTDPLGSEAGRIVAIARRAVASAQLADRAAAGQVASQAPAVGEGPGAPGGPPALDLQCPFDGSGYQELLKNAASGASEGAAVANQMAAAAANPGPGGLMSGLGDLAGDKAVDFGRERLNAAVGTCLPPEIEPPEPPKPPEPPSPTHKPAWPDNWKSPGEILGDANEIREDVNRDFGEALDDVGDFLDDALPAPDPDAPPLPFPPLPRLGPG